ncbi:DNA-directed DNA polymerase [Aureococcus anophagefferens]|nr:DNA-directed DNA polymerase [Aureococcus anophagefferens]
MAERPPNDASRIASVATSLFAHAAAKGGQEGLDREKVNNIIFELSGSSSYTKEKLEHRGDAENEAALEATRRAMDAAGTVCCVVDFDMFYAAVELRDRPELKDKPVAVGGPGMITTANYVARKWGVRSAMPGFIGQELCRRGPEFGMPRAELVFVRPDFEKYTAVSKRGAGFEPGDDDDDEAEADGVGDDEAPDGDDEAAAPAVALPPLDLRDDAAGRLADAASRRSAALPEVHALFAPKGRDFLHVALGVGAAGGPEDDEDEDGLPKGLGNERTFRPVSGLGPLLAKLEAIAAIVAGRLETRGMRAARATLKLKTSAFHVTTRDARAPEGGPTRERYVQSAASLVALLAPLLRDEVAKADERGAPPSSGSWAARVRPSWRSRFSIVAFSALILAILRRDVDMPLLGVGGADAEIMGSGAAPAYPRAPAPRGKQSSTSAA